VSNEEERLPAITIAYSALASFKMGISGSASFQREEVLVHTSRFGGVACHRLSTAELEMSRCSDCHFSESRMRTTSESLWPRMTASCLPSKDQSKSPMSSDLKSVSGFPGEPSRCWSQRLSVSPSRTG